MMKGVAIKYGDVAPGAKESFVPYTDQSLYETLPQLQLYNERFENYGNPCEQYLLPLDGETLALPENPSSTTLGLWSSQLTDGNGEFATPIELVLESVDQYSSQGITFTFDTNNNIYPQRIKIEWLRITQDSITILSEKEFFPDNPFFYCENWVENYNKVVTTFYSLNMPHNRLRLRAIDYGYGTIFYGKELRNVHLKQTVNPISSEIEIDSCDFILDSKSNMEYSFQKKQPLSVYHNGHLKATMFVGSSNRTSRSMWNVKAEDYIGLMDAVVFLGDIYVNKVAYDLLEEIFATANVPYKINPELKSVVLSGHIPITTCRNALMQIAFATQNAVVTAESDVVNVVNLNDDLKQTIPRNRVMSGATFNEDSVITEAEITIHSYMPKDTVAENAIIAYNSKDSGVGTNIMVKFSEPLHSLYTLNDGEIVESSANYAIINARANNFRLIGYSYEHTTITAKKRRDAVNVLTAENVVSITDATMVSATNAETVLNSCYDWLSKQSSVNLRIVEGKQVTEGKSVKWGAKKWGSFKWGERAEDVIVYDQPIGLGDRIDVETEYMGVVGGRVIEQSYTLGGNIIVKEAVIK